MNIVRLILREIAFRRLNFVLGVAGMVVAVGCLTAGVALLRSYDRQTDQLIAARQDETRTILHEKEVQTRQIMAKFQDDTRKLTVKMGFNLLILPEGQRLTDLYDESVEPKYMPEEYAHKLADSKVATINHILPNLTQRVKWPEKQRKVMLTGVKGEVYLQSREQKPILEAVAPGSVVVGYELHKSLGLKVGQKITFMGQEFAVSKLQPERGNFDDVTLWIDLKQAQELVGKPGQITAILALECNCEADRLDKIRAEVTAILGKVEVIEFASQAIARAEMRTRAAAEAQGALDRERAARKTLEDKEKAGREEQRKQREMFAGILSPVVCGAAAVWISLLTLANVRERRSEIGILRAIGLRARQIIGVFLGKTALMGAAGAVLGLVAGTVAAALYDGQGLWTARLLVDPALLGVALVAAPIVSMLAGWVPAILASQQDPAIVLQEE